VTAYALPEFRPIWQTDEISTGIPSLLPLGDAGVVAAVGTQLFALSADGELLWQEELPSRPLAWAETDRQLILTTTGLEGGTYLVAETGVVPFLPHLSGKVTGGARPFLYNETGVYQLDLEAETAELLYTLPQSLRLGNMVALPDGGALVAHADTRDRRLLAFNADGSLRWQRSIAAVLDSLPQLAVANDQLYLLAEERQSAALTVPLFALDLETAVLTHLFDGGTLAGGFNDSGLSILGNGLLLNVGGAHLLAFDPQTALSN
jgi:outer membrane protein assembly factor BamB